MMNTFQGQGSEVSSKTQTRAPAGGAQGIFQGLMDHHKMGDDGDQMNKQAATCFHSELLSHAWSEAVPQEQFKE